MTDLRLRTFSILVGAFRIFELRTHLQKKTFEYGKEAAQEKTAAQKIGAVKAKALQSRLEGRVDIEKLLAQYKVARIEDLTENDHADILRRLSK